VKEPGDVVKVGQIVKVQVLSADAKAKRIALSMKALTSKGSAPKQQKGPAKNEKPTPSMDDRLAALSNRWKTR
jgi:uncharacterized protein